MGRKALKSALVSSPDMGMCQVRGVEKSSSGKMFRDQIPTALPSGRLEIHGIVLGTLQASLKPVLRTDLDPA